MSGSGGALVGIDLGTTAVKVVANRTDGRQLAEASRRYALHAPKPGFVEQDPEEIYRATMAALTQVLGEVRLRGDLPLAIGFSAAMHGVLAVDASGEPISPLVNWMDRRSAPIAEGWQNDGTAERLYQSTGAPMHPMLPLCKLRWLRENEPGLFARAARFVGMKELFTYRWTGEWLVDHAIAGATGMFDIRTRGWNPEALGFRDGRSRTPFAAGAMLDATRDRAPGGCKRARGRRPHGSRAGLERRRARKPRRGGDRQGHVGPHPGHQRRGAHRFPSPALDPKARTFCYPFDDAQWLVGGPTSSAGAVLEWFFALVLPEVPPQQRFERAVALASEIAPGADGVTVLPFLSGERAPYWRADLRGEVTGLDLAHDRRHVLRAAFESEVFSLRSVHDVLREIAGAPSAILLSGGITHAELVRQMIADVFEIEARLSDRDEASAFGAAMMAGIATGSPADAAEVAKLVEYPRTYAPGHGVRGAYRAAFARYTGAVEKLLSTRKPLLENPSSGG